jgi:hypothetical protein
MNIQNKNVSSKTLYKDKNIRNINWMIEIENSSLSTSCEDISNDKFYFQDEMSLKEKTKNFLESYNDLVLLISNKKLVID